MRIFKDVHLVEQLGSGMSRILSKYDKSIFKISPNFIKITFMFENKDGIKDGVKDDIKDGISEVQIKILEEIKKSPEVTITKLSEIININKRNVEKNIKILKELTLIERKGCNKKGWWEIIEK